MPEPTDTRFRVQPGSRPATRNFQQDLQRLAGLDIPAASSFNLNGADGDFLPGVDVSQPGGIRRPSVSSGPMASRLVEIALAYQRNPSTRATRLYNPTGPTVACASFVSTVLRDAGAFAQTNDFTRWCPDLPAAMAGGGAVQVIPRDTPMTDNYILRMQPGDVILFHNPGARFKHTGIYIGDGQMVDTSSSELVLKHRPVRYLAGNYARFAAFRFSR